jgi:hypothetical protein
MRFDRKDRKCTVAGSGVFLCVGAREQRDNYFTKMGGSQCGVDRRHAKT